MKPAAIITRWSRALNTTLLPQQSVKSHIFDAIQNQIINRTKLLYSRKMPTDMPELTELRFYVPHDTEKVISETFFLANLLA